MTSNFDLAVLGADDPLGEAVLKLLEEREIPVGQLQALTLHEPGASVGFMGEDWPCLPADEFDFSHAQALLIASRAPAALRLREAAARQCPAMPILGPDGVAPAPAVAVSRVLRCVTALAHPVAVEAFVVLPVATAGKAGVDELADQSRRLFNLESPEPEVFPLQVAFNLMPFADAGRNQDYETQLAEAARRLCRDVPVGFSVILAPLFFGAAISLHVLTEKAVDMPALRHALAHQEGITLMETDLPGGMPTPATDAAESDDVFVGQIKPEGNRLRFWLVLDPMRLEAAQMVTVVENWIDMPANSMLT